MVKKMNKFIDIHFKDNLWIYIFLSIFLFIGIVLGSLNAKGLNIEQESGLLKYIDILLNGFDVSKVDNIIILKQSLLSNLKMLLIIWFLGLTVLGVPLVFIAIGIKGFYLGFTSSFIIQQKGLVGIVLTVVSLIPQNLFNIPAYIIACVLAITFSIRLYKGRKVFINSLFSSFFLYTLTILGISLLIFIGALVEAYVVPILLKFILSYL